MIELATVPLQRYRGMTVFPIVPQKSGDPGLPEGPPCILLADALEAGTLTITEEGGGSVPWMVVRNVGRDRVLILDGEQFLGGKQNRIASRSIILPRDSETRIPVSCMEQGRWSGVARAVGGAPQHSPSGVRRKAKGVEAARASAGYPASEDMLQEAQSEVWSEISKLSDAFHSRSPTQSLDDVYRTRERDMGEWLRHFPVVPEQVGILVFAGDQTLGLDEVSAASLWERLHTRLLKGYVIDAMETELRNGPERPGDVPQVPAEEEHAERFIRSLSDARRTEAPTVGEGRYDVLSGSVIGGELTAEERLMHRCAFPAEVRGDGSAWQRYIRR